ncbi:MAG: radical SAM protein [Opitutaceae bacterium]|nr:radical SAM protein [Opitutaceae bacterium]
MVSPQTTSRPARVLLVNLNSYDQPYPVYPLGLAYLDGALREAGHEPQWWDARMSEETIEACLARMQPDLVALSMRNIDNVQAHNPRSFIHAIVAFCRQVRAATRAPLALGGSGFSVFPRELYELTGVDYGVQGEGERTLIELIAALQAGRSPAGISGVVCRDAAGAVHHTPAHPADAVFTVDPRHDPALLRAYLQQGSLPGVQTQRGCPLRCVYCTYPLIEGKRSRYRTGDEIVAEFRRMRELGVEYVFIVDSVFNTRRDHVEQICRALADAKTGMEWECFLRPAQVDRDLLQLMHDAGMRHVEFSCDSFSDPVLKTYGKSFKFADAERASRIAHEIGLRYSHFLIFGGPGETPASMEETIARAVTLPGAYFFVTIGMRIYPDTPLWRQLAPESRGERAGDYLVEPRFYLEPPLTTESIHARLLDVVRAHPNWTVGDPPSVFVATMEKLRKRGVRGPMWEYAEFLQRMQAAGTTAGPAS